MTDQKNIRIAGSNIKQLPFESIISKLMYLSFVNNFQFGELYRLLTGKKSNRSAYDLFDCRLHSCGFGFSNLTGLNFNADNELLTYFNFGPYKHSWFSPFFRICPLCLENGYHSYWYQLHDLYHCPIHGSRIEEVCHSCGNTLPMYSLNRNLFDKPYFCMFCNKPLSGAAPDYKSLSDLRSHGDEIQRRFRVYEVWAHKTNKDGLAGKCIPDSYVNSYWSRGKFNLKVELGRFVNPVPNSIGISTSLTVITWRIQMIMPPIYVPKYRLTARLQSWSIVLRAAIRRLEYWIFGSIDSLRSKIIMSWMQNDNCGLDMTKWNLIELTYAIFRTNFGNDRFCRSTYSVNNCFLRELPRIGFSTLEGRLPRIAIMSALLGIFSGLYRTLVVLQRLDKLNNTHSIPFVDNDLVMYSDHIEETGYATGVVILPKIDNFPLKWSASIRDFYAQKR